MVLTTGGYIGLSVSSSPVAAGLAVAAGGAGAGAIYTVAVNTPVKWFNNYRGLATGSLTMSYALLSFGLIPIARENLLGTFQRTLLFFAILAASACLLAAIVLRDPQSSTTMRRHYKNKQKYDISYAWTDTVRTWQFWVLYIVFIIVNGVGLMLIGKLIAFANALEMSVGTATTAASVIAIADGSGGLIIGGVSDRLGALRTAGISLIVSAIGIAGAVGGGLICAAPVFIFCIGVAGFFRSPVFAIFPTIIGEYYGNTYSSENYAALYTAKLWGSLLAGSIASIFISKIGWSTTFLIGAILLGLAGFLLFSVQPVAQTE